MNRAHFHYRFLLQNCSYSIPVSNSTVYQTMLIQCHISLKFGRRLDVSNFDPYLHYPKYMLKNDSLDLSFH